MALDLIDLRAKITTEASCALEAVSRVRGIDKSEVVREVMHRWALQQIETCRVMHRLLRSEGDGRAAQGKSALDWE